MQKLVLCCSKVKPYLYANISALEEPLNINIKDVFFTTYDTNNYKRTPLNGKVIVECDVEIEKIFFQCQKDKTGWTNYGYKTDSLKNSELYAKSYRSFSLLDDYFCGREHNQKVGYAIHIKNLHIYEKARELDEFEKGNLPELDFTDNFVDDNYYELTRVLKTPSSAIKVRDMKDYQYKFLLSRDSFELSRILNGKQTVIVVKKLPKKMLNND